MKLKTILEGIRDSLKEDIIFEDHQVIFNDSFKLHFVSYDKVLNHSKYRLINWEFAPFIIPSGMSPEDAFKVLSYLTDYIESHMEVEEASIRSLELLESALDLPRLGFQRLQYTDEDPISLYTVGGRLDAFKKSEFYQTYFEWYQEGITKEEVEKIYASIGLPFEDLVIKDNEVQKVLTKDGQ